MIGYRQFLQRKAWENVAVVCYENNLDPTPLLEEALRLSEEGKLEDEQVLSELLQGVGNFMGQVAGAAKTGVQNLAQGVAQGYNKWQNPTQQTQQPNTQQTQQPNQTESPQAKANRLKSIQNLSTQLNQLNQLIPQMSQQLKTLQSS